MTAIIQSLDNVRLTGQTSVSATPVPLTKVGDTSSGNTAYATDSITDSSAGDLSAISVGDVVITQDGYKGLITAVDDGSDKVTVGAGWLAPGAERGRSTGNVKPTDGQTATIIRIARARSIMAKASSNNSDIVRFGRNGTAAATDYPRSAGLRITFSRYDRQPIDVSQIYIRADSGTQTVAWCVGGAKLGGS